QDRQLAAALLHPHGSPAVGTAGVEVLEELLSGAVVDRLERLGQAAEEISVLVGLVAAEFFQPRASERRKVHLWHLLEREKLERLAAQRGEVLDGTLTNIEALQRAVLQWRQIMDRARPAAEPEIYEWRRAQRGQFADSVIVHYQVDEGHPAQR